MKRHVQTPGVRKWAGSHLIELQSEPLKVLDDFFADHGPFVVRGCEVTKNGNTYNVAAGLVVLEGKDYQNSEATMVVPFAGASGVSLPLYLTLDSEVRQRTYNDGIVRPIAYDYYAKASTVLPAGDMSYLALKASGTPRYLDAIQDTKHRFITDTERATWNGAVSDLTKAAMYRGKVSAGTNADTLTLYGMYEVGNNAAGSLVNFPELLVGVLTGVLLVSPGTEVLPQLFIGTNRQGWMRSAVKENGQWTGWTPWERVLTQTDMENFDPYMVNQIIMLNEMLPFADPKFLLCDGSIVSKLDYPDLLGTPIFAWEKIADAVGVAAIQQFYRNYLPFGKYVFFQGEDICFSDDGINWTQQPINKSGSFGYSYASLTKFGSRWVVYTGQAYQTKYSDNERVTWATMTRPISGSYTMNTMNNFCYGNNISAVVSGLSTINASYAWFSMDLGNTWTKLTLENDPYVVYMTFLNGKFLIGTKDGKLCITTDFDFRNVEYIQLPHSGAVTQIYYGNGTYVVRSADGVCISSDLVNWTYLNKTVAPLGEYYFESGVWGVVGTLNGVNGLYLSTDLITWEKYEAGIANIYYIEPGPLIVGNNRLEIKELRLDRIKLPNVTVAGTKCYVKALK